jgi:outer membrane murein-binding lipoprotein Lpp
VEDMQFSIDRLELIEEINDSQFALLDVYVCHDNLNSHNLNIPLETIQRAANTLLGKPLTYSYKNGDFLEHEKIQFPMGYFLENNDIRYVQENGKTYLVARAVLWKVYCEDAYSVFCMDEEKEVSMEIIVLEKDENNNIIDFVFRGVTVLGSMYHAACPGSRATVLKFSEMVEETKKIMLQNFASDDDVDDDKDDKDDDKSTSDEAEDILENAKEDGQMAEEIKCEKCGQEKCTCAEDKMAELENQVKECNEKCSSLEAEKEEMSQKFSALEEENTNLKAEIEELRIFKANVEKDEKMSKIEYAINAVGEDLTPQQKDEWRGKAEQFENVEAFSNAINAFAYTLIKGNKKPKEEVTRVHIPKDQDNKTKKGLWD